MANFKSSDSKFHVTIKPCSEGAEVQDIHIETHKTKITFYDLALVLFVDCFCKSQNYITASKLHCTVKTPSNHYDFVLDFCSSIDDTMSALADHITI